MESAGCSWWQVGGGAGRAWPAPWDAPTQSFVRHVPRGGICLPVWTPPPPPSLNVAMLRSRKHSHCLAAYVCYFWHLPSIIRVLSGTDPASRPDATERGTSWPFPVARRCWVRRSGGESHPHGCPPRRLGGRHRGQETHLPKGPGWGLRGGAWPLPAPRGTSLPPPRGFWPVQLLPMSPGEREGSDSQGQCDGRAPSPVLGRTVSQPAEKQLGPFQARPLVKGREGPGQIILGATERVPAPR